LFLFRGRDIFVVYITSYTIVINGQGRAKKVCDRPPPTSDSSIDGRCAPMHSEVRTIHAERMLLVFFAASRENGPGEREDGGR
jgi:hypothetical protein